MSSSSSVYPISRPLEDTQPDKRNCFVSLLVLLPTHDRGAIQPEPGLKSARRLCLDVKQTVSDLITRGKRFSLIGKNVQRVRGSWQMSCDY